MIDTLYNALASAQRAGRRIGLGRLGLVGRLAAVVFLLTLALLASVLAVDMAAETAARDADRPPPDRQPALRQTVAIVELFDRLTPAERAAALPAVSTETLRVTLRDAPPDDFTTNQRMPLLEAMLARTLRFPPSATGGTDRSVFVIVGDAPETAPISRQDQIDIAAALSDGGYVVIQIWGDVQRRVLGVPVGFLVGVAGLVFAALALWALAREARPIRRLAASVTAFAADGAPRPTDPAGAPEIRGLIEAVNAMQSDIARLIRGRTLMLGAVSHDLKTYITRLRLRVEAIEAPDQNTRAVGDLDAMTRLVDDALAVARGADLTARREPVDLAALLVEEAGARAGGPGSVLVAGDAPALCLGDPAALKRLFVNLIDNAVQAADRVVVTVQDGALVRVDVDDDGPGVPEDRRADMFEPFARLDPARTVSSGGGGAGSGLGLAIVRSIAEAHGGGVEIADSPLGGARLTVTLPPLPDRRHAPHRAGSVGAAAQG